MFRARRQPLPELPPVFLDGARIFMRPPRYGDYPAWQDVRRVNHAYLQPFEPSWDEDALSQPYFRLKLERHAREWKSGAGFSFLIFEKDKGALIGGMNINHVCRGAGQYASLGYWISEAFQGQGYMSEALGLTLEYAFTKLHLHRVHAACIPHNRRSRNLLLRAGFKEEGFAEKYISIDGRWQDHYLYGLTCEDWLARSASSGVARLG